MPSVKPLAPDTLTSEWIAIPSESAGHTASDSIAPERRIAEAVAARFAGLGLEHRCEEILPGRFNVSARLPRPGAPRVLIAGHLDTVSASNMAHAFTPERSGRRLRGRGACDDKGPFAAALAAVSRLLAAGRRPEVDLTLLGTADEESGHAGARAWAKTAGAVDLVIALEPTGLRRIVAHKGALRGVITTEGVSCHSSMPERGRNAIAAMVESLGHLAVAGRDLEQRRDALLGHPTFQVTVIQGGGSINTIPDRCEARFDLRLVPGLDPAEALDHLRGRCGCAAIHEIFAAPALAPADPKAGTGERFLAALRAAGVDRGQDIAAYCTDAAFLQAQGPCVVWGPGRIEDAHTADEGIDLDELDQASEAIERFLA